MVKILIIKNWYLTLQKYSNWIEILEKLLYSTIRHVYISNSQEPRLCSTNCLRLVIGQSRVLTLCRKDVLCNGPGTYWPIIIKGAKFHRRTRESCENLRQDMQGILTQTTNGSITGLVTIPCVTFFSDIVAAAISNSVNHDVPLSVLP